MAFGVLDTDCPLEVDHPHNHGLVAWHLAVPPLDGGRYSYDLAGRNHGTLTNGPSWRGASRPGGHGCLTFDGVNDYVDCGVRQLVPAGATAISFGCWARADTVAGRYILMGQNNAGAGYTLQTDGAAVLYDAATFTGPEAGVVTAGRWTHWFVTWDGATVRLYQDGVSAGSASRSGTLPSASARLEFGAQTDIPGFERYLPGAIDDAPVYSRALPPAEVAALYEESRRGHSHTLRWVSSRAWFLPPQASSLLFRRNLSARTGSRSAA